MPVVGRAVALAAITAILCAPSTILGQGVLGTTRHVGAHGESVVNHVGVDNQQGGLDLFPETSIADGGSFAHPVRVHPTDTIADQVRVEAEPAFNHLLGMAFHTDLSGTHSGEDALTPGVYWSSSSAPLTSDVHLNLLGHPDVPFAFPIGNTRTTDGNSSVTINNGGSGVGVYWQVGSSETHGSTMEVPGNSLAQQIAASNSTARFTCGHGMAGEAAAVWASRVIANDCTAGDIRLHGSVDFITAAAITTVPEPSTFLLLGSAGLALAGMARRRARSARR